jgi:hypothetical protein
MVLLTGVAAKQFIHFFYRDSFRLRNEKPDPEKQDQAESCAKNGG